MDAGIHESKYHWGDVSWNIKINVKGVNIAIVVTMVAYKLKVMHNEYDTLNFWLIRQNSNSYPREENNCGDDSSIFILDYDHLFGTIIDGNTYIISNNIMESRYSVLSYIHIGLHIGDSK